MSLIGRHFQSLSPTLKRLAYAAAAVPTLVAGVGLVQGVSVLIDYRLHHKDAPQPISPASGEVMISSQDAAANNESAVGGKVARLLRRTTQSALGLLGSGGAVENGNAPSKRTSRISGLRSMSGSAKQPLRLLVVGDSLAVGVGMSESASPVLPESISRALSKALGGRAVTWTCIGTSGASAGRIVRDIESYHSKEVKADVNDEEMGDNTESRRRIAILPQTRRRIRSWLDRNLTDATDGTENEEESANSGRRNVQRLKNWLHNRVEKIDWLKDEDELYMWKKWRARSTAGSCSSEAFQEYDVAIVLTGLNDIKDAVLPFLSTESIEERKARRKEKQSSGGYEQQLEKILQVLKDKMNYAKNTKIEDSNKSERAAAAAGTERHLSEATKTGMGLQPLIVLPGLPATIVPVFQWVPLKWFLVPLISSVDKQKRNTSHDYQSVLFVEPPAIKSVIAYESGLGPIISDRRAEKVHIIIQDIGQKAKEKIEVAMDKYYEIKDRLTDREASEKETERQFEQSYHQHSSAARPIAYTPPPGSKLFSADGIHPNDDGYDYYGRHIASAIIAEWAQSYASTDA